MMDACSAHADQILYELAAAKAINELRASYGWHAARGDFERIVALFTPDGLFETRRGDTRHTLRGQEEIRAFLRESMIPAMVFPMLHNEIVVVQGETAYGTCAMESRSADGNLAFSGYYHDKARLESGRWRFTERRYFTYVPVFERSGLDLDGKPESGLAAMHHRALGQTSEPASSR